jgi:hypothetical protein
MYLISISYIMVNMRKKKKKKVTTTMLKPHIFLYYNNIIICILLLYGCSYHYINIIPYTVVFVTRYNLSQVIMYDLISRDF